MHHALLTLALTACGDVHAPDCCPSPPPCCAPVVAACGCYGRGGLFHGRRFGHFRHRRFGCYGCFGGCYGCYGGYGGYDVAGPTLGCASCFGTGTGSSYPITVPDVPFPTGAPMPTGPSLPPVKPMPQPSPALISTTSLQSREPASTKAAVSGRIVVDLPADARCYIDDQPTRSTQTQRTFETPDLDPSKVYSYTVRAEVVRNGRTYTRTAILPVVAGETSRVNFTNLGDDTARTTPANDPRP